MLVAPLLCALLVFLAPPLANAIARREGQRVVGAAGWTALLGPGVVAVSGIAVLVVLRGGGVLTLDLGLPGRQAASVVLSRADLAAILTVAAAGGVLTGVLLWGRATRPSLYSVALLVQGAAILALADRALWPAAAAAALAALVIAVATGVARWRRAIRPR